MEDITVAMKDTPLPHIAILPSPGMGHLNPLAEFAKRLVLHHNFSATFITISVDSYPESHRTVLDALPKAIDSITLPPIPSTEFPQNSSIETRISLSIKHSLLSVRDVLNTLKSTTQLVALVVDHFGTDSFDVAREFGIAPYMFFTSSLMMLSFLFHFPTLDATYSGEFAELTEPVILPGCIPVSGEDLPNPVHDRSKESYAWMLHRCRRAKEAEGILVNSFMGLEPAVVKALKQDPSNPPFYPVGPLIKTDSGSTHEGEKPECLRWLDEQPRGSVLYVSFGSGGTLSSKQLTELACGLEMSGQRFLWVARSPHDKETNATFFSVQSVENPFDFLPKGFLARTKGLGLVVPSWAPQLQVLSHGSTGGFLSHCGWNSTLESIINGVPMIAWPLYAEQKMNAAMLAGDLKVALRPRVGEMGLVGREEIARVINGVMVGEEGKRLKDRMQELRNAGATALDEGGSSYTAMREAAHAWESCRYQPINPLR
ncbi:hydroquinone glucosyltransferase-like [Magnolia sinica]|uniref:hydroquinone glucosyltransferase-like n=1 Tax=Magnolia sinica TaxID=86752 RepID=UPI00265B446E|nr:hydroquinone glucosyltransferase-like [Magnolia sinica]